MRLSWASWVTGMAFVAGLCGAVPTATADEYRAFWVDAWMPAS